MPRERLRAEIQRYMLARALRGEPTADDVKADEISAQISDLSTQFTRIVGSKVSADYLESLAHIMRRTGFNPGVAANPLAKGLLDYKRPAHRPRGSRSARTGYDLGFVYLIQKRAGWTIAQIARQAEHLSTDPHDARLTTQAWRARVSAAIKQELARERLGAASGPFDFANLPRGLGLLGLAAELERKE